VGKSYREQLNDIRTEIGNIATSFSKGLAEQAHEDLKAAHRQIIDNFYAAHDPNSYNRKEGLYDSIIPQGVNHSSNKKNTYEASIVVGSFRMDDHYRGDITPDNIFDLMWNKGVRGLPKIGMDTLDHNYTWLETFYDYGNNPRRWENPYWSGQDEPYHNIFLTKITMGSYTTKKASVPNIAMIDFVNHWKQANGKKACDKLYKEIKNKYS
jgi:hypothetical protein